MIDFWTIGPTAAAFSLRARGFSPQQAERLVRLKQRYERGKLSDLTEEYKRLRFVRWLVQHRRLSDGEPPRPEAGTRSSP